MTRHSEGAQWLGKTILGQVLPIDQVIAVVASGEGTEGELWWSDKALPEGDENVILGVDLWTRISKSKQ
jgi:hypothetical protein